MQIGSDVTQNEAVIIFCSSWSSRQEIGGKFADLLDQERCGIFQPFREFRPDCRIDNKIGKRSEGVRAKWLLNECITRAQESDYCECGRVHLGLLGFVHLEELRSQITEQYGLTERWE